MIEKDAVKFTKEQVRELRRIALEKKLKGAEILNGFTEDEMVESFNGAGGSADSELKRWILTKILNRKLPAVLIHDMAYRKGGSDEDFARANRELGENISMMDDAGKSSWWNFVGRKAREYTDEKGRPGWGKV